MKKPLPAAASFGLVTLALIIVGGAVWFFLNPAAEKGGPSPELRAKQEEYQRSIMPKYRGKGADRAYDGVGSKR